MVSCKHDTVAVAQIYNHLLEGRATEHARPAGYEVLHARGSAQIC